MRRWLPVQRNEHPLNQWFSNLDRLHEDIDQWFEDFSKGFPGFDSLDKMRFGSTRVEVLETEKDVLVNAELPGVENQDLDVRVYPREVTIKAEKKKEKDYKDDNIHRSERFYGRIARTVPLPAEIETDQTRAEFKNGILKLTLPKIAPSDSGKRLIIE